MPFLEPVLEGFPVLALPDVEETIAFRAIDKILRNDAGIRRVVYFYLSWTGDIYDGVYANEYTTPFLQIAPVPMRSRWESEGQQRLPFSIGFTVSTNGTDVTQIMNLWCLVRRAIYPKDPARYAANRKMMLDAGIVKDTLALGGFSALFQKGKDAPNVLFAQGKMDLLLLNSTP